VRIPGRFHLLQESWQVSSVLGREEVSTPSEQATDAHRILGYFIAPHGAIPKRSKTSISGVRAWMISDVFIGDIAIENPLAEISQISDFTAS
jgi:hypothetical protein